MCRGRQTVWASNLSALPTSYIHLVIMSHTPRGKGRCTLSQRCQGLVFARRAHGCGNLVSRLSQWFKELASLQSVMCIARRWDCVHRVLAEIRASEPFQPVVQEQVGANSVAAAAGTQPLGSVRWCASLTASAGGPNSHSWKA